MTTATEVRVPEHTLKARTASGRIEIALWRTEGKEENGRKSPDSFSVRVKKTYYKDKQYRDSNTLFPDDLLVLSALCQEMFSYCVNNPTLDEEPSPEEGETPF